MIKRSLIETGVGALGEPQVGLRNGEFAECRSETVSELQFDIWIIR